ncbi:hypothetical protein [Aurantiacibacter spongiae]|uniref:Lipoprotein n=1 Tax=Aurantiacibacter spongiae TaxID=2488860 RepID=A0A3N5CRU5_9SPHN|nr:hypothetical protein [Aurantiacibacter spongiae]RPF71824.1 hypothetical protein EG799_09485 [Aurantiacibacter spongiae]
MSRRFSRLAALFALLLGGCETIIKNRVETALVDAGLPSGMANCMSEIWADDLSVSQIKGISDFADAVKDEGGRSPSAG